MSIHAKKVRALFKKDMKDALKNGNLILMALLPLVFTVIYRMISIEGEHMDGQFVMTLGVLMAVLFLPLSSMSMMIAEEKEKNTLRTLMLSNVSAGEFLLSKSLVIFIILQVVNILIFFSAGLQVSQIPLSLLITSFASLNMILLGALIGIVSKNQMSTGMISAPLALVLMLPSVFAQISDGFATVAQFIPTYAMLQLLTGSEGGWVMPVIVLAVWTIAAALLFTVVYQKKRLDD